MMWATRSRPAVAVAGAALCQLYAGSGAACSPASASPTASASASASSSIARDKAAFASAGLLLQQAQVVFRHGARTPWTHVESTSPVLWLDAEVATKMDLNLAPVSVIREDESKPLSAAEVAEIGAAHNPRTKRRLDGGAFPVKLTRVGMEQGVALGARLRERYLADGTSLGLVPPTWSAAKPDVYMRSTTSDRTIETAQGVFSGLFPDNVGSDGDPAKIYVGATSGTEWGFPNFGKWCTRLNQMFKQGVDKLRAEYSPEARALLDELDEHVDLHVTPTTAPSALSVYRDYLSAWHAHGKQVPAGVEKIQDLMPRLLHIDSHRTRQLFAGADAANRDEALRLYAGRMLRIVLRRLQEDGPAQKDADGNKHKLVMYSGHDWTIIMLLQCMDPDGRNPRTTGWPGYCSDLAFESWRHAGTGAQYVRVVLDGEPLELPHLEPHGELPCVYSLRSVEEAAKPYLLHEHDVLEACDPVLRASAGSASSTSSTSTSANAATK